MTSNEAQRSSLLAWLRDRSVRAKILAAVGVVGAMMVAVGLIGLSALSASAARTTDLHEHDMASVKLLDDAMADLLTIRVSLRSAILAADEAGVQQANQALLDAHDAFEADYKAYSALPHPAEVSQQLAEIDKSVDASIDYTQDVLLPLAQRHSYGQWIGASKTELGQGFANAVPPLQAMVDRSAADATAAANASEAAYRSARTLSIIVILVGLALGLGLGWVVANAIARNVARVKDVADALAEGDLTHRADVVSRDEVGLMAASLDAATGRLRELIGSVVQSADLVAASSEELSATSQQIAAGAEETSVQSTVVSRAADEVSRNVQTVAAGSEQMNASIREIAQSANEAARVASQAVSTVEQTNATVAKLGTSSQEIGDVVKVITSIAEQTNLLALNATIEAARAGDAGKGFAVVASEVKDLAQETARATEDIARRVEAIQADTGGAVTAMGDIAEIIASINDYQLTIASAVEEQTATTNEMARNVAEASTGAGEIATNITGVSAAAESTTQALAQTQTAVDELAVLAGSLRTTVGQFVS